MVIKMYPMPYMRKIKNSKGLRIQRQERKTRKRTQNLTQKLAQKLTQKSADICFITHSQAKKKQNKIEVWSKNIRLFYSTL